MHVKSSSYSSILNHGLDMLLSQSQKENHKVVRSFYFDRFYVKIHTYLLEFHAIQPIGKLVEQLSFNHGMGARELPKHTLSNEAGIFQLEEHREIRNLQIIDLSSFMNIYSLLGDFP